MKFIEKIKETFKQKKNIIAFMILFFVLVGILLSINTYGLGINSYDEYDYLEDIYWSEALLKSGKLISNDFTYYYMIPFGANIIMAPFVALLGPCMLANQIGMIVFLVIYLVAIFTLARSLFKDFNKQCYFVAIVSMFTFTYIGDQFWHHVIYYNLAFVCSVGQIGCSINIFNKKNSTLNYIGLIIWTIWGASNGLAIMALSSSALIISLFIYMMLQSKPFEYFKENKKIILISILSTIIGYVLNILATLNVKGIREEIKFVFDSAEAIVNNLFHNLFVCYLENFYVLSKGLSLFSVTGIGIIICILFAILVATSIYFLIHNWKKSRNEEKFVYINGIVISLICIAQFSMMKITNERFIFNATLYMFIVLAINVVNYLEKRNNRILILTLLLCFMAAFLFRGLRAYSANKIEKENKEEIISILEKEGLYYGFSEESTVWYTLSEGKIKAAGIKIVTDNPQNNRGNIPNDFYNKPDVNKFFVIITDEENNLIQDDSLTSIAIENKEINGYYIYVYDIEHWDYFKSLTE